MSVVGGAGSASSDSGKKRNVKSNGPIRGKPSCRSVFVECSSISCMLCLVHTHPNSMFAIETGKIPSKVWFGFISGHSGPFPIQVWICWFWLIHHPELCVCVCVCQHPFGLYACVVGTSLLPRVNVKDTQPAARLMRSASTSSAAMPTA